MGVCLDAGIELAKAYKDTPDDAARQAAAVTNFSSKCMGGGGIVHTQDGAAIPAVAGAATTQPNAVLPMGQVASGPIPGVLDTLQSSGLYGWLVLGFWLVVAYVGFIAVLAVVKKVRRI